MSELCDKKEHCYWRIVIHTGKKPEYACGYCLYNNCSSEQRGRVGQDCPQYKPLEKPRRPDMRIFGDVSAESKEETQ